MSQASFLYCEVSYRPYVDTTLVYQKRINFWGQQVWLQTKFTKTRHLLGKSCTGSNKCDCIKTYPFLLFGEATHQWENL